MEITALFDFSSVKVRPLSRNIEAHASGRILTMTVPAPAKLSVEPDGDIRNPPFLLINPPETARPASDAPNVRYFAGGQVYDAGEIVLKENETLYIP